MNEVQLLAPHSSQKRCNTLCMMRVVHSCQECRSVASASCPADKESLPAEEDPQEAMDIHAQRIPHQSAQPTRARCVALDPSIPPQTWKPALHALALTLCQQEAFLPPCGVPVLLQGHCATTTERLCCPRITRDIHGSKVSTGAVSCTQRHQRPSWMWTAWRHMRSCACTRTALRTGNASSSGPGLLLLTQG